MSGQWLLLVIIHFRVSLIMSYLQMGNFVVNDITVLFTT